MLSAVPGADVDRVCASLNAGESRRRCGRVAAQMWASRGADVGESRRRCGLAIAGVSRGAPGRAYRRPTRGTESPACAKAKGTPHEQRLCFSPPQQAEAAHSQRAVPADPPPGGAFGLSRQVEALLRQSYFSGGALSSHAHARAHTRAIAGACGSCMLAAAAFGAPGAARAECRGRRAPGRPCRTS